MSTEASPEAMAIFRAIQPIFEQAGVNDVRDALTNSLAITVLIEARGEGYTIEQAEEVVDGLAEDIKAALRVNWKRG